MRIGLAIPFYNKGNPLREEITRASFNHYTLLQKKLATLGVDLHIIFVGSELDVSKKFCKPFSNSNTTYVEFNQNYESFKIRDKFNFGLLALGDRDFYCICGSNDFVFLDMFLSIKNNPSIDLMGIKADKRENNLVVIDYEKRTGFKGSGIYPDIRFFKVAKNNRIIGGFYAISKRLFNDVGKTPFQTDWDEVGFEAHCIANNISRHLVSSKILNIKTDSDITSYADIKVHHFNGNLTEREMTDYLNYLNKLKIK